MTTLEEAQPMLNEAEVVDALAIEYVHNNTSIGAKKSLARVTFRILTGREMTKFICVMTSRHGPKSVVHISPASSRWMLRSS